MPRKELTRDELLSLAQDAIQDSLDAWLAGNSGESMSYILETANLIQEARDASNEGS